MEDRVVRPGVEAATFLGGRAEAEFAGREALATQRASDRYAYWVLIWLAVAYAFNYIDRSIVSVIGHAIKLDLKLTDTQLGLLGGPAFVLIYTVASLPIARLAERVNRVNVIAVAFAVWSACTALCGFTTSFGTLLASRVAVGMGEAGLLAPAHSLISDYFTIKRRSFALSVFSFGVTAGMLVGSAGGAWLAQRFSWRIAFLSLGAVGLLVALGVKLVVREAPRGGSDDSAQPIPGMPLEAPGVDLAPPGILEVARRLFTTWSTLNATLGIALVGLATFGVGQFSAPYLIRQYGVTLAQAGLVLGLVAGVASGAGILFGGKLADIAGRRNPRWGALVPACGLLIAAPLWMIAYTRPTFPMAVCFMLAASFFQYFYFGPTVAVVQNAMGPRMRATASALSATVVNLIAMGLGPPLTGWLIDHLSSGALANLGQSGRFAKLCPGGVAHAGATTALQHACGAALAHGTRLGILITLCFYVWAGVHYLLASLTLPRDLDRLRAH